MRWGIRLSNMARTVVRKFGEAVEAQAMHQAPLLFHPWSDLLALVDDNNIRHLAAREGIQVTFCGVTSNLNVGIDDEDKTRACQTCLLALNRIRRHHI